jgi:ribosome biogenesis protein UTP30
VKETAQKLQQLSCSKRSLLTAEYNSSASEDGVADEQSLWLYLTTKQHIVDKNRLKPTKIRIPHSLNKSSSLRICIISADPQHALKDVLENPTFPKTLSDRFTKIIGFSKLKARYHSFESRRQLLAEHDIFLADDRIINRLPDTLGKVFYKGTSKRPIPIAIAQEIRVDGKRVKQNKNKSAKEEKHALVASPDVVAKEIETALNCVPVSLKPGVSVAVRVGNSTFTPQALAENISAVTNGVIEKCVVKGWRNIKSIHIKSSNSAAMPIWLADDLWVGEERIADEVAEHEEEAIEDAKQAGKKRKARSQPVMHKRLRLDDGAQPGQGDREMAQARRTKLMQQKSAAFDQGISAA